MGVIIPWFNESAFVGSISPACKMCSKGSKLVLWVTGLCPSKCFYCPISLEKCGKDQIFADEWELINENNTIRIIKEASYIKASGAGITGGDPLIVWDRVEKYIRLLKEKFGKKFHIHLYTSGMKNSVYIRNLVSAGLDEIRFHPMPFYWSNMDKNPIKKIIEKSLNYGINVALEIPSIPGWKSEIFSLIKWSNKIGLDWININELEYSEKNYQVFNDMKYTVRNDISAAVKGSQDTATEILKKVSESDVDIGIHYCSSSFKDGIQLKRRIKRRAESIAQAFDTISKDGTLLKGVIELESKKSITYVYDSIKKEFRIPEELIHANCKKNRIELALWILEEIANVLKNRGFKCYLVEEYPTADALEVEKIPLPL